MQKISHQTYYFEDFTLDLTRGRLLRAGAQVKVRPKTFLLLTYLVMHNNRLISKEELIGAVWPDTAVTDDSLVQCLKDVRYVLGDGSQTLIKTVPRRGYIFDRAVNEDKPEGEARSYIEETTGVHLVIEEEENDAGATIIQNADAPALTPSRVRRLTGAVKRHKLEVAIASTTLAALVIAGAVFAKPVLTWWFKPPSIAVLPFINATTTPDNDYLTDGITDSVIMNLAQINEPETFPRLLVAAQSTSYTFKGRNVNPQSAGREMGVDQVLVGRVEEQNGEAIIHAELINVANGSGVWHKTYFMSMRGPDDLLDTQAVIAKDVAENLPLKLTGDERQRLSKRYTQSPDAYLAFLKGRASLMKGTPSGLRESIEHYQRAIDLDPNFALAYWTKGVSIAVQGVYGLTRADVANEEAGTLYRKALMLDASLYPAKAAIQLQKIGEWDWAGIEKEGKKNDAYGFPDGGYLVAMGQLDEVLDSLKQLLAWAPTNGWVNYNAGRILFLMRRDDEAAEYFKKAVSLSPNGVLAYYGLGRIYLHQRKYDEAIAEFQKADDLAEHLPPARQQLGYAYAVAGRPDEALKILSEMDQRAARGEYVTPLGIAWIYIALGDKDQAFAWLGKACDEHSGGLPYLKTEPVYDSLRQDPRFADVLRRVHLPT
jgi:DNA-binding winged helix-turn-helix (wHTH) protein/TolB-like protein/tetratricopeptide (TPR) repeat protein